MKSRISKAAFPLLIVAVLLGLPIRSRGGTEMVLSVTGVTGDATNGLIAIDSLQWGEGRTISDPIPGPRVASEPIFSEVTISKVMDSSSPTLAMLAANGMGTNNCVLTIKNDATGEALYTLTLENVYISGYSVSSGGDVPSESLSLNYTKITWVYQPLDGAGNPLGKASPLMGWDLAKQAPIP